MDEKYGFVYIWRDRKHKRYYLGSHWGSKEDGYICSSTWMKNSYKRRGDDFKRRVIAIVKTNKADLLKEEERWLQMMGQEEIGKKYYNLKRTAAHWSSSADKSKSVGDKISRALTGRRRPDISKALTGRVVVSRKSPKPFSEEHKRKLSAAGLGRVFSEETKIKISKSNTGQQRSDEFKAKRSEINKAIHTGSKRSEETKKKMSEAHKARHSKVH